MDTQTLCTTKKIFYHNFFPAQTLYTTKKIFYYNFFPTKADEEYYYEKSKSKRGFYDRTLIEMRDIYPPRVVDHDDPWIIKKTLNDFEAISGKLRISSNDALEHVLRHWNLAMAIYVTRGVGVGVIVWDVTEENTTRKYERNYVSIAAKNDFFVLTWDKELIKDREVKGGDEVCLYWDIEYSCFMFKVVQGVLNN